MSMENVEIPADLNEIIDRPDPSDPPAEAGAPAPSQAPAAPATPDPAASGEQAPVAESFPRDYVEQLRNEAADRRVALKPYEDAFKGYESDEVQTWLGLIKLVQENPAEGAAYMAQVAQALGNQYSPPDPSTLTPEQRAAQVTQSEIEKFKQEQKEEREREALQRQVEELNKKAEGLGYELGSSGYLSLLHYAQHKTNGDLDKAHTLVQADVQKIIDAYVQGKAGAPPVSPGAGVGSPVPSQPETLEEARESLDKWLDEIAKGTAS